MKQNRIAPNLGGDLTIGLKGGLLQRPQAFASVREQLQCMGRAPVRDCSFSSSTRRFVAQAQCFGRRRVPVAVPVGSAIQGWPF